jgi:hypothetical protein
MPNSVEQGKEESSSKIDALVSNADKLTDKDKKQLRKKLIMKQKPDFFLVDQRQH